MGSGITMIVPASRWETFKRIISDHKFGSKDASLMLHESYRTPAREVATFRSPASEDLAWVQLLYAALTEKWTKEGVFA